MPGSTGRDSATVIARVLVAVDSADDLPLVDAACALAQEHRASLEIVGGIARAAPTVALVACPRALNTELEQYSATVLCDAIRRVPADPPGVWRQVPGCARHQVLHAAQDRDRRPRLVRRPPGGGRPGGASGAGPGAARPPRPCPPRRTTPGGWCWCGGCGGGRAARGAAACAGWSCSPSRPPARRPRRPPRCPRAPARRPERGR